MSLEIAIGKETLDLEPGTSLELEMENPFLQFSQDEIIGTFSLPFKIMDTEKNRRLTNFSALLQKKIDTSGIDIRVGSNGYQHSLGKLKIEKINYSLNDNNAAKIDAYYLTGSSAFAQDIKGKTLRDINLGGERSIHKNALKSYFQAPLGAHDFCFFPVINRDQGRPYNNTFSYMNGISLFTGTNTFELRGDTVPVPIVPFMYFKYLIVQLFKSIGWTITCSYFDDPDFNKLVVINFSSILPEGGQGWTYPDYLTFDLVNHVPKMGISEFLGAIRKRFGLWYEFDEKRKHVSIKKVNEVFSGTTKDWTKYVNPKFEKSIDQTKKTYSVIGQFSTSLGEGVPDYERFKIAGMVNSKVNLPPTSEELYGKCYLVIDVNTFFICVLNDEGDLEWQFYAFNIYNIFHDNSTTEIITACTPIGFDELPDPHIKKAPRVDAYVDYQGSIESNSEYGIILCFYLGNRPGNGFSIPYPQGTPHLYDSAGLQVTDWGIPFDCYNYAGQNVGLFNLNLKKFLNFLNSQETCPVTFNLPLHEFRDMKFSDKIIIDNTLFYLKNVKYNLPYNGQITCEALRIM